MQTTSKTVQQDKEVQLRPLALSPPIGARQEEFSILRRRGPWRDALRRRMLAAADALAVVLSGLFVDLALRDSTFSLLTWLLLVPVWLVLAKVQGLYDRDHRVLRHLTADEFPSLLTWATTGAATIVAIMAIAGVEAPSVSVGVELWLGVLLITPALRALVRWLWRTLTPPERTVLVGSGPLEQATRRKIELFEDIHVTLAGVIADEDLDAARDRGTAIEDLVEDAVAGDVHRLVLASQAIDEPLIAELVAFCRFRRIKLSVVPPARAMFGTAVRLGHIADLPMIEYNTWDVPRSTMLLKRAVDVVVAATGLILTAPLMAVIAVAIRLESGGPSLFAQGRAGYRGLPFRMFKFRTMVSDAEHRLEEVVNLDRLAQPAFKLRHDPRVTRVGRLLRRWSLDELPQLINVLKGDMSLVGPRPEVLSLVERYRPEHRIRLHVKPGLTGPMQVYGRGELRFDERLAVEREYVENLSISRDMRILLLTVAPVLWGRGAY